MFSLGVVRVDSREEELTVSARAGKLCSWAATLGAGTLLFFPDPVGRGSPMSLGLRTEIRPAGDTDRGVS